MKEHRPLDFTSTDTKARSLVWLVLLPLILCGRHVMQAQVQQEATPATAGQPGYTLQTTVRRIFVDVVVTDQKGHAVPGLKREDFQVYEDGVPQPLRGFDVHEMTKSASVQPGLSLQLPPNTFANIVRAPEDSPVTVILYDLLNTPMAAMPYAHDAMVRFIKDQKSSSRIAIFVLSDRLHMLQGFTDDETRLVEALNNKSARTQQSSLLMTNTEASDIAVADAAADTAVGSGTILSQLNTLENEEATYLQKQRLEITIDAFAQIARFVSSLSGRKNLLWLSGSFPSAVLPNNDPSVAGSVSEFSDSYSYAEKVEDSENLLNKNHVAVYPVDVRGLQVDTRFSAATNVHTPLSNGPSTFTQQQNAEHSTMDEVAESTGGHAFYNTNGLRQAMQSALADGSTYYTLTYAPTNIKSDGTLRKIKVQLREPGYQLSYRRSYFADASARPGVTKKPETADANDLFLQAGMQHGAPLSSELFFKATVLPVGTPMAASPEEMKALSEFMATKTKRNKEPATVEPVKVQHYEVSYAILGRQLELPPVGDGKYATDMIFALAAYTPDSEIVNGLEINIKNTIPAAQYQKIKANGYHATMVFAVPVASTALRIAARDDIGNHIGTIEVPLPVPPPPPDAPQPATLPK